MGSYAPFRLTAASALLAAATLAPAVPARAHIRMLEPASWVSENLLGDPQKDGPCGTFEADPPEATGAITTYQAGETITVRWQETVAHPGHFRIALAENRDDLADPDIQVDNQCNYAPGAVDGEVAYPVLLDNLFPRTSVTAPESFEQEVTLPNTPCEKCTLQLIQFMTSHAQPCIYYHCADIRIVGDAPAGDPDAGTQTVDAGPAAGASGMEPPATGGAGAMATGGTGGAAAGSGGAAGTGTAGGVVAGAMGSAGTAGEPVAGAAGMAGEGAITGGAAAPSSGDDGGCAVASGTAPSTAIPIALALWVLRRRRRRGT